MKFDTHTHTHYSLCAKTSPQELIEAAEDAGLGSIVVCDHNEVDGAIEARRKCIEQNRNLIVEFGIELGTEFGEIGAKFLTEEECRLIMAMRNEYGRFNFKDLATHLSTLKDELESDMMLDLHHPYDFANPKRGFDFDGVIAAGFFKDMRQLMRFFDFTEMNAASTSIKETQAALSLAKEYRKPIVCSSDSHFPRQVGKYYTETSQDNIIHAILERDLVIPKPEDINYQTAKWYRLRSWTRKRFRKVF